MLQWQSGWISAMEEKRNVKKRCQNPQPIDQCRSTKRVGRNSRPVAAAILNTK